MLGIITQSALCFFAIYGIIQMALNIYKELHNILIDSSETKIIVTVKNGQDTIEGIVRALVWRSLNNKQGGIVPEILIADLGSEDETPEILKRLFEEYSFIEITDSRGLERIIEEINK